MLNRSVFAVVAAVSLFSSPVRSETCNLPQEFAVMRTDSVWQITHRGRLVMTMNSQELRDIYGGAAVPTDCSNIYQSGELFAFRMGWKLDLLMAFGIKKSDGFVNGLKVLRYYPHDSAMNISVVPGNQLAVVYGRKGDLNARFCWNPNGAKTWFHNADHRRGLGPCVNDIYPFSYSNSSQVDVTF